MSSRITLTLDADIEKELRLIQAEFLANKLKTVTFTEVVNNLLRDAIFTYKNKENNERLGQMVR